MAIILGSKFRKDLPDQESVAIGITLPFSKGNNGYFKQAFQTSEQIKSNIKNLILTNRGERLMHPSFGTTLQDLLFSQFIDGIETQIETSIETAVRDWMPFVSINEIVIDKDNSIKDKNQFNISISYRIAGQQSLETVEFQLNQQQ